MKALYDIAAPAKLNLFLHVTGQRADGYHLLQSVFMLIDWCDILHFECRTDGLIRREDLGPALPADDLIVRAARLLQRHSACTLGAHIAIDKRIPAQAGMGGGSSDAASVLLALNRLWQLGLSQTTLEALGLQLGADVPFFLRGHNAWVEGIGEHIRPVALPRARFVVVKPGSGLATRDIFSHPDLSRSEKPATIAGFAADYFGFGRNSLQAVAETLNPEVMQALAWLQYRGLQGRMTGSGSAVFAHWPEPNVAAKAEAGTVSGHWHPVPAGWQVRVCGNLDVHPLAGWAPSDG